MMQTAANCDLCANPPAFMCNECSGHDMSAEGREIVKAMHAHAPQIVTIHTPKRSIIGQAVPADFMYV